MRIACPESVDKSGCALPERGRNVFELETVTKELNFVDIEPVPQSCSLQRQLDRYMATLPSVNPGALSYALRPFLGKVLSGAPACRLASSHANTRSILAQRQLCTAVSKPFIYPRNVCRSTLYLFTYRNISRAASSSAFPLSLFFSSLPRSHYLPSSPLPLPSSSPLSLHRQIRIPVFCIHAVGEALRVKYRYSRLREFSTRRVDETKIDTVCHG